MKLTSLNVFKGKITRVIPQRLGADLVIELAPGLKVISRLTAASFAALNPRRGQAASAVIPALDVIVAPGY
jgi:molybdopterin-binding protein